MEFLLHMLGDEVDGLQKALSEISSIRDQVARNTQFRGYGPVSVGFSGVLALVVAYVQVGWFDRSERDLGLCLLIWTSTAAVSISLSGLDTFVRSRRVHSGLAKTMMKCASEQFLPALVIGILFTAVLIRVAPQEYWLLPGVWALIFSLGIFASCRFLPRQMFGVGIWYLTAGLFSLATCATTKTFSPWAMGVSFGVGQLLVAAVLQFGFEDQLE